MATNDAKGSTPEQYSDDAKGNASRWSMEFSAAKKEIKPFHDQGDKVVKRYLDKGAGRHGTNARSRERRLNLYTRNTQILMAMLYGKTPTVDVSRKFGDSTDGVARVAGEVLERLLNGDIEKDSDTYAYVLQLCLEDRLIPGMGNAKLRYECEFEDVPGREAMPGPIGPDGAPTELAPAVPVTQRKSYECVEVDYVKWRDQLWSPCNTFLDCRWWGFKNEMSKKTLVKKFGEEVAAKLPMNTKKTAKKASAEQSDATQADPWQRCDVWEIWDKERECVWFYVEGYAETLIPLDVEANEDGSVPDPLELEGFWPSPRPMVANATTSAFIPESDFVIAQDLYDQIDDLETRIFIVQKAIAVRGLYDSTMGESVARLLDEACENELIPVKNWGAFKEKGGINGSIDWLPLEMLMAVLQSLMQLQQAKIAQADEMTGTSDVMRGSTQAGETATAQRMKGTFGSIRVQTLQDEFARFASDIQKLKAEIISTRFDAETIIQESNIMNTPDAPMAMQAVQLIKSQFYQYRIQVKPESVSMTDFAQMKSERQDFIQGTAQFLTSMLPVSQAIPNFTPAMLELYEWYVQGFKGSSSAQGIMDRAIAMAEKMLAQAQAQPQQQAPDPKLQVAQLKMQADGQKGQMDIAKIQAQAQSEIVRINAETQALAQRKQTDAHMDVQEEAAKAQIKKAFAPTNGKPL